MASKIKLKWPICLDRSLLGGQSFRWTKENDYFIGVFNKILWKLSATEKELTYEVLGEIPAVNEKKKKISGKVYEDMLRKYLRLDTDLFKLYEEWKKAHEHFSAPTSDKFVTQLDQDVVENIFSFILSQNNNISRISLCVERLCSNFGEKICVYKGKEYYGFPTIEALTKEENSEEKLRALGFGYRAKYILKTAQQIAEKGGSKYLNDDLKNLKYEDAKQELLHFTGIGPKVADCICLMSLNHLDSIPVDTHVIQIAKHYVPELNSSKIKSLSSTMYKKISDAFRKVYGENAGWAQTHLFCNELVRFNKETSENSDNLKPNKKIKK